MKISKFIWSVTWLSQKTFFDLFLPLFFEHQRHCLWPCQGIVKPHSFIIHISKVSPFPFCPSSTYCLFMEHYVNTSTKGRTCEFILLILLVYILFDRAIGLIIRVFTNSPGRIIPKAQKMIFYAALPNTQHYKVRVNGKVEKSREWSSALPYTSV